MSAAMELMGSADAFSLLAGILDCTQNAEAIRVTALAEFIRSSVYQPYHWESDWGEPQPVHTNRIKAAARRDLGFLWKNIDYSTFHSGTSESDGGAPRATDVLRRLGEVGDIVELGGGFWAPGPVRIVSTSDDIESALLVIGGTPFETLKMKFATRISCVGCGRFVHPDRESLRQFRVEQDLLSVDDWLGGLPENLTTWSGRVLRALEKNMSPAADIEASECEIYVPDDLPGKPGRGNWLSIRDFSVVPTGPRLCRPSVGKSAMYDRPMYLAKLREDGGRATFRQLTMVPADIRLRLMFGFEQMYEVQRSVTLEINDQISRARISFKLPYPESRILAFGWPVGTDQKGRTNVYEFSSDLTPFLIQVLGRLNIRTEMIISQETRR